MYEDLGYQTDYPDRIQGLNFDIYDKNAAILTYTSDNTLTGTTRLIFDSVNKLPSESKLSSNYLRSKYENIGEISRLIINNKQKGLNIEFKYLMEGIYTLFMHNKIDITFFIVVKKHYKLYSKFGGIEITESIENFGNIKDSVYMLSWNPALASNFFKKAFLR